MNTIINDLNSYSFAHYKLIRLVADRNLLMKDLSFDYCNVKDTNIAIKIKNTRVANLNTQLELINIDNEHINIIKKYTTFDKLVIFFYIHDSLSYCITSSFALVEDYEQ